MEDVYDLIKNVDAVYSSNTSFQVLKDFERVLETLDIYVYENWLQGELLEGPRVDRHWVTCSFMWPKDQMPNPRAAKRLFEHECRVKFDETVIVKPRKIEGPDDFRPGTTKGKLDRHPIWVVTISMPKKLGNWPVAIAFTGGNKAPKVPASAYPAALAKNQTPINKEENRLGANLETRDKPIGDKLSSPMV